MKNSSGNIGKYEDLLFLPHPVSENHPRMSLADRAAQFSPFAALTGYGVAIQETGRLTDGWPELDEDQRVRLDEQFSVIQAYLQVQKQPQVTVRYFQPDERKEGGAYRTLSGAVKRIDRQERRLVFADGASIPVDEIMEIGGELFDQL